VVAVGFDRQGGAECDCCGDVDDAAVMAFVEGHGVLCWKCARLFGLFEFEPSRLSWWDMLRLRLSH
jgi:hypothetical protein